MKKESQIINPSRKVFNYSISFAVIFFLVAYIGTIKSEEYGMDVWGIVFISGFLCICSLVAALIFWKLTRETDNSIKENKIIAKFEFNKKEWAKFQNYEYDFRKNENIGIFIILSFMTSIIFILFILFIPEGKLFMFIVMLLLIVFYAIFAFVIPFVSRKLKKLSGAQIVIFSKGLIYDNIYHSWNMPLSKLEKVVAKEKPFAHIEISYSFFDRLGPRQYCLIIPILKKYEKDVKKIIKELQKSNKKKKKKKKK